MVWSCKTMTKNYVQKCVAYAKFVFFAIVCLFFCRSHRHCCLALHDFIFCLRKFINESFAFNPG